MINALIHTVLTGDFLGYAVTGVEEDHPVVLAALALHQLFF